MLLSLMLIVVTGLNTVAQDRQARSFPVGNSAVGDSLRLINFPLRLLVTADPFLPFRSPEDQLKACWYDSSGNRTGVDYCHPKDKLPPCAGTVCQLSAGGDCGSGDYAKFSILKIEVECPATFMPRATDTIHNSSGMNFVSIPAGTFAMGSTEGFREEKPVHTVTLSRGFYMGTTEVTQTQWVAVMGSMPASTKSRSLAK